MNKDDILKKLSTIDYQVILVSNMTAEEVVTLNSDNSYTIVLNDTLSIRRKKVAFLHAAMHMIKDHFYDDTKTATQIEADMHEFN